MKYSEDILDEYKKLKEYYENIVLSSIWKFENVEMFFGYDKSDDTIIISFKYNYAKDVDEDFVNRIWLKYEWIVEFSNRNYSFKKTEYALIEIYISGNVFEVIQDDKCIFKYEHEYFLMMFKQVCYCLKMKST